MLLDPVLRVTQGVVGTLRVETSPSACALNVTIADGADATAIVVNYAVATTPAQITAVQNAADGSTSVAPGGFISVYGSQMSATSIATSQIPLPTALGQSCLVVNGSPHSRSSPSGFKMEDRSESADWQLTKSTALFRECEKRLRPVGGSSDKPLGAALRRTRKLRVLANCSTWRTGSSGNLWLDWG
jgi:hypothetical protein